MSRRLGGAPSSSGFCKRNVKHGRHFFLECGTEFFTEMTQTLTFLPTVSFLYQILSCSEFPVSFCVSQFGGLRLLGLPFLRVVELTGENGSYCPFHVCGTHRANPVCVFSFLHRLCYGVVHHSLLFIETAFYFTDFSRLWMPPICFLFSDLYYPIRFEVRSSSFSLLSFPVHLFKAVGFPLCLVFATAHKF